MNRPTDTDDALQAALAGSRILVDAPEPVIQRVLDLFPARRPAHPATYQPLTATLRFDSRGLAPQAAGVRSGGGSDAVRQLLFSAEGRDIDLRIAPDGSAWQISGQVLGPDSAGTAALDAEGFHADMDWSELCEFHFAGVPAGTLRLTLRGDTWELELPTLQIPDPG